MPTDTRAIIASLQTISTEKSGRITLIDTAVGDLWSFLNLRNSQNHFCLQNTVADIALTVGSPRNINQV